MAALLIERLEPYRRIREEMSGREEELWDILRQGSQRASTLARAMLEEVRSRIGFPRLRGEDAGRPPDLTGRLCC